MDATAATEGLLKLYDPVGREVHSEQVTISEGINEFDLGQLDRLTRGIYLLKIESDFLNIPRKVIKID